MITKDEYRFVIEVAALRLDEHEDIKDIRFCLSREWLYFCNSDREYLVFNMYYSVREILNRYRESEAEWSSGKTLYEVRYGLWTEDAGMRESIEVCFDRMTDALNCVEKLTQFLERKRSLRRGRWVSYI